MNHPQTSLLWVPWLWQPMLLLLVCAGQAEELRAIPLQAQVTQVQPGTGIALWSSNSAVRTAPIQLEFSYLSYRDVVTGPGQYNWERVDNLLESIASRKHQAILRWHDTYVGKPSGVPEYIRNLPDYRETLADSEQKPTAFPDWSHPELRRFLLEFVDRFAERYDNDPRIAYVQVGFGLWAEYHIYDGPMELGRTFPARDFQREFLQKMQSSLQQTPWMISVDAAGKQAPFAEHPELLAIPFGLFDDSFNHARHERVNEPNWNRLGRDRWQVAPMGGEFSFYERKDQTEALAPNGPHGIPFSDHAARFHVSFIIGDSQPRHQSADRLREAGQSCGYRFRVTRFESAPGRSLTTITNTGIAPIYYDAFPAVAGVRSSTSLRGLLPRESREFEIAAGGTAPQLAIESDRLVPGQAIEFDADLP